MLNAEGSWNRLLTPNLGETWSQLQLREPGLPSPNLGETWSQLQLRGTGAAPPTWGKLGVNSNFGETGLGGNLESTFPNLGETWSPPTSGELNPQLEPWHTGFSRRRAEECGATLNRELTPPATASGRTKPPAISLLPSSLSDGRLSAGMPSVITANEYSTLLSPAESATLGVRYSWSRCTRKVDQRSLRRLRAHYLRSTLRGRGVRWQTFGKAFGLYAPSSHSACGVGVVANVRGVKSRSFGTGSRC